LEKFNKQGNEPMEDFKTYIIVSGTHSDLESFEQKINHHLNEGYIPAGQLSAQTMKNSTGADEIVLFQPMINSPSYDEDFDEDDDDDEFDEDDDDLIVQ
jgi:hypothetical protein